MLSEIRERLKEYLAVKNLSANSLESAIGVSKGTLSKFINGHKENIGIDKIIKIGNYDPNLDMNWLLKGDGKISSWHYEWKNKLSSEEYFLMCAIEARNRKRGKDNTGVVVLLKAASYIMNDWDKGNGTNPWMNI